LVIYEQAASRRSYLEVHEFPGQFQGHPANFKMTSVIGHVLRLVLVQGSKVKVCNVFRFNLVQGLSELTCAGAFGTEVVQGLSESTFDLKFERLSKNHLVFENLKEMSAVLV
jgi:hypothetical protein